MAGDNWWTELGLDSTLPTNEYIARLEAAIYEQHSIIEELEEELREVSELEVD